MIWFTADLQLGNRKVAGRRGFKDVDEHDTEVLSHLHRSLTADDELWILGNIGRDPDALVHIEALPCPVHLIYGNSDPGHPMHSPNSALRRRYRAVFGLHGLSHTLRLDGDQVLLHHFPYSETGKYAHLYPLWRPVETTMPVLHGHTHSRHSHSSTASGVPQVNVGLDSRNLWPVDTAQALASLRAIAR